MNLDYLLWLMFAFLCGFVLGQLWWKPQMQIGGSNNRQDMDHPTNGRIATNADIGLSGNAC
jgi:hypothetical protein